MGDREGLELVAFSLDDQRYVLPLSQVQRSLRVVAITPLPGAPMFVLGIIDLAGTVVAVIDTRKRFDRPPRDVRLSDVLVVATTGRRTVALLVDAVEGVLAVPAEATATELPRGVPLVRGAVKRDDGLILIHDLGRLLSLDDEAALDHALEAAGRAGGAS